MPTFHQFSFILPTLRPFISSTATSSSLITTSIPHPLVVTHHTYLSFSLPLLSSLPLCCPLFSPSPLCTLLSLFIASSFPFIIFTPFVLVRVGSAAVLAVRQYGYGLSASARSLSATGYVHCRASDAFQVWSRVGSYSFYFIFTPFVLVRVGSAAVLTVHQYGYGLSGLSCIRCLSIMEQC
jgi:hypothetical protein